MAFWSPVIHCALKFDIQKLKPFLFIAIIIFAVFSSLNRETIENTTKPKKSKNRNKEIEDEFSYDEENYEDEMRREAEEDFLSELYYGDLKIKIEEKIIENELYHAVLAIGNITSNFNDDIFKSIKKDNDQVKFTIYVFDVTDKEKETVKDQTYKWSLK